MDSEVELLDRYEQEFDFYLNRKRYKDALDVAAKMLASFPNSDRGHYLMAFIHEHLDNHETALESINNAISLAPHDSDYFVFQGDVLLKLNMKDEALHALEEALRLNPQNENAFCGLYDYYSAIEDDKKALSCAKKAIEITPTDYTMQLMVDYHLKKKDYPQAKEWLDKVLHENPSNAFYMYQKGVMHLGFNQIEQSMGSFLEALRLNPLSDFYKEGLIVALRRKYPIFNWYQNLLKQLEKRKSMLLKLFLFLILPVVLSLVIAINFNSTTAGSLFGSFYFLAFIFLTVLSQPITNLFLMKQSMASAIMTKKEKILSFGLIVQFLALIVLFVLSFIQQSTYLNTVYMMVYSSIFFIGTIASNRYIKLSNTLLVVILIVGLIGYIGNERHSVFSFMLGVYQLSFAGLFITKFLRFLRGKKEYLGKFQNIYDC